MTQRAARPGSGARQADPKAWALDKKARERRAAKRQRRADKDGREHQEWMAGFQRGAERVNALSEAEFQARLRSLSQSDRDRGERLLEYPRIRKLLLLALTTGHDAQADAALIAARRLRQQAVTQSLP